MATKLKEVLGGDSGFPHEVTDPERIPTPRYYDPEFYQREVEKLWPHVWQMACRLEQIPNVGDWIEYSNLGHSVMIVHTKDGSIKAYHNACRHRGVPLTEGGSSGNCKRKGFICPFHGWQWDMEGNNRFVYGKHMFSERQLDQDDLKLPQARVELWGGFVFVNFDDDAPGLHEQIGDMLDNMGARNVDTMRAEWWYSTELPANWKIAMEAFMEGYHVLRTHPQLHEAVPTLYNSRYGNDTGGLEAEPYNPNIPLRQNITAQIKNFRLLSEGMAGMVHGKEVDIIQGLENAELPEDDPQQALNMWFGIVMAEITRQLGERGENVPNLIEVSQTHPVQAVEFLFPNMFMLPTFTSMSVYRIRPTGPETCRFEIWSLTQFPKGEENDPVMEPRELPYDSTEFPPIPQQDYSNIPLQQQGCHAEGFDFMRLSNTMEGLISNYNRIIDGYLRGTDLDKLATATRELGGNFDGPIKELDV